MESRNGTYRFNSDEEKHAFILAQKDKGNSWNWIAQKTGETVGILRRVVKNRAIDESMRVPLGRRPALSAGSKAALVNHLQCKDSAQNSVCTKQFPAVVASFIAKDLEDRGLNPLAARTPCEKTIKKYKKELKIETVSKPSAQNERRHDVAADPRTQLAFGAVFSALMGMKDDEFPFSLDLFFNTDATTILLEDLVGSVQVAAGSRKAARKQCKSIGKTMKGSQKRVIALLTTTSAAGILVCMIAIIKDRNFKERRLVQLATGPNTPPVWLLLEPTRSKEAEPPAPEKVFDMKSEEDLSWAKYCIKEVIGPASLSAREAVMTRDADIAAMMQPDPSKRSAPLRPRIIHTFDGELDFLNAAIDVFIDNPPPSLANQGIELGKFPASSSKTNQPCDVAKSYLLMKGLANRGNLGLSPAAFVIALPEILKDFDGASYKTYSNFLAQLPDYISQSFTSITIKKGWKAAGLFPLDLGIIMGRCTTWRVMSASQGAAIMAAFPGLIELARQQGELSDQDLQNAVGESIDFDAWILKHGLQSVRQNSVGPTTVLNHRRVLFGSTTTPSRQGAKSAPLTSWWPRRKRSRSVL